MRRVAIVSFARTPISGQNSKEFLGIPTQDLGIMAGNAAIERSGIPATEIEGSVWGHVSNDDTVNIGRLIGLSCGMDCDRSTGFTVNRVCGSGLQAVASAAQEIWLETAETYMAGGCESLSRPLYSLPIDVAFTGLKPGTPIGGFDTKKSTSSPNEIYGEIKSMGQTAENIVRKYGISREDADLFAYQSQMKVKAAYEVGRFDHELIPVEAPYFEGKKIKYRTITRDMHPRPDTTLEALAKLRPVYEEGGTVTAGNASGSNDGAAALIMVSEDYAKANNLKPIAYVTGYAFGGVDPRIMGMGPVPSIRKLLARADLTLEDIDVLEINEAFAAQVLGCLTELGNYIGTPLYERLNPNGGACALGHPLGMTGVRLVGTVALELALKGKRLGVASACIGGGQGAAILIENANA